MTSEKLGLGAANTYLVSENNHFQILKQGCKENRKDGTVLLFLNYGWHSFSEDEWDRKKENSTNLPGAFMNPLVITDFSSCHSPFEDR